MANTTRNFTQGKMNKMVDERLVPNGEYVDALNVRMGSTEGSEIGVVENSKGINLVFLELSFTSAINWVPTLRVADPWGCIKKFSKVFAPVLYLVKSVLPSNFAPSSPETKLVKASVVRGIIISRL